MCGRELFSQTGGQAKYCPEMHMIGVVLWSNVASEKAVIWCEDQGDLAFLNIREDLAPWVGHVSSGDMLCFEIQDVGSVRTARDATLVARNQAPELADVLESVAVISDTTDADTLAETPSRVSPKETRPKMTTVTQTEGRGAIIPFPANKNAKNRVHHPEKVLVPA